MGAKKHPDTLRAMELVKQGSTIAEAADRTGINQTTLYRALYPKGKRQYEKELALRERTR